MALHQISIYVQFMHYFRYQNDIKYLTRFQLAYCAPNRETDNKHPYGLYEEAVVAERILVA